MEENKMIFSLGTNASFSTSFSNNYHISQICQNASPPGYGIKLSSTGCFKIITSFTTFWPYWVKIKISLSQNFYCWHWSKML